MVAQYQIVFVAKVRDQPRLLGFVQRKTFVVVIGDGSEREQRLLRDRKKPVLLRRNGDPVPGVKVHHAQSIFARSVNRAVDCETGWVDVIYAIRHLLSIQTDLHQARCSDLIEHQPVRIYQKVVPRSRYSRGDVRENQIIPSKKRN